MGNWNSSIQYQKLNKVRYTSTGGVGVTLLAKKANKGIEPFISQEWQEVWMIENYDGLVTPVGTYPEMTAGNSIKAENDGTGNNIANQFSEVTSDIRELREDINTESHFRGMFESVAALQTAFPTATPNDYAYIVGGNIYIWQNSAWTDSGKPSPNTAVPASNTTPLMDGNGSVGVSSAYARGDHRHPQDSTKLDKSGGRVDNFELIGKISFNNGNEPTYIELGKTIETRLDFHAQPDLSNRTNYDACIAVKNPTSSTASGTAETTYLARLHTFIGEILNQFGQAARGHKSVAPGASLVGEKSGFYSDAHTHYSKYFVAGEGGDKLCIGWEYLGDGANKLHVIVYNNENIQTQGNILFMDAEKDFGEPSTAKGWDIGGTDLSPPVDGVYVLTAKTAFGWLQPVGFSFGRYGIATQAGLLNVSIQYINSWSARSLKDDSSVAITQVAYKKII